jgi:hypothetical protein
LSGIKSAIWDLFDALLKSRKPRSTTTIPLGVFFAFAFV